MSALFWKKWIFLGSPLLENEDAHSLLLLFSIRLGGLVEEILRLNSFMRSSIEKSRWLENFSSEILQELQSEFQQLISPIPLWSPRWHEATKLIYDYHMKSSWGVLPGCCYFAQRSICVPSAALWAFLH